MSNMALMAFTLGVVPVLGVAGSKSRTALAPRTRITLLLLKTIVQKTKKKWHRLIGTCPAVNGLLQLKLGHYLCHHSNLRH